MKISTTPLEGVLFITLDIFYDKRGKFIETYNEQAYVSRAMPRFVQDDLSYSKQGVLRGIHGDPLTRKLVSCAHGRILLRVYDCRLRPSFGESAEFELVPGVQVYVPAGFGNAYFALEDSIYSYKQSGYYDRSKQFTYRYDDPRMKQAPWPVVNPILSERDDKGPFSE